MRQKQSKWWSWSTPVRVDVEAAGFTIAPLMPQYAVPGSESQESLVTLVLKADLGGMLSGGSAAGRLLSPVSGSAVRSMLEPVVTSIVVLRDQVEQNRFVIRPLSHMLDMDGDEQEPGIPSARTPDGSRRLLKSNTMLAYNRSTTLAEAQERATPRKTTENIILDKSKTVPTTTTIKEVETKPHESEIDETWAIAGTCQKKFWLSPGNCNFKLRGKEYLQDKKKVSAAVPMFELVAVDLLELEEPMYHICQYLPSVKHSPAPFLFCVQMMVPSSPPVSLISTWAAPMELMGVSPEELIVQFENEQGPCPENVKAFFHNFTQ